MKKSMLIALIRSGFFVTAAQAAQPMIHVSIRGVVEGAEDQDIRVQVPIAMLESFRPAITDALSQAQMDGKEIDFRALWQEIKAAGPNEYVSINNEDGNIKVSTTETHLVIKGDQGGDVFDVKLPLALGDALLAGEQVDFEALMAALDGLQGQDLVNVDTADAQIRVWIE